MLFRSALQVASMAKQAEAASEGISVLGAKAAASSVGLKAASGAVGVFGKALTVMTGPIGIAIAAITALISIIASAVSAAKQANIDTTQANYDDAYTKSQVDTSSFDAAYAAYQKTGEVTDELTSSSKSLADQLDITGSSALINAGNFDTLAEKIDKAKNEATGLSEQFAKQQLANLTDDTWALPIQKQFSMLLNPIDLSDFADRVPDVMWGTGDVVSRINQLNKAADYYQKQVNRKDLSDKTKGTFNRRLNNVNSILGQDNYQQAQQIIEQQAKTA